MAPRTVGSLTIPYVVWWIIWVLIVIIILIILGIIIHALGGGDLAFHAGHFHFDIGVT
jgi:hypothetical protein